MPKNLVTLPLFLSQPFKIYNISYRRYCCCVWRSARAWRVAAVVEEGAWQCPISCPASSPPTPLVHPAAWSPFTTLWRMARSPCPIPHLLLPHLPTPLGPCPILPLLLLRHLYATPSSQRSTAESTV